MCHHHPNLHYAFLLSAKWLHYKNEEKNWDHNGAQNKQSHVLMKSPLCKLFGILLAHGVMSFLHANIM
jgi:hypothetical protein